jgi:hypothetical protein
LVSFREASRRLDDGARGVGSGASWRQCVEEAAKGWCSNTAKRRAGTDIGGPGWATHVQNVVGLPLIGAPASHRASEHPGAHRAVAVRSSAVLPHHPPTTHNHATIVGTRCWLVAMGAV